MDTIKNVLKIITNNNEYEWKFNKKYCVKCKKVMVASILCSPICTENVLLFKKFLVLLHVFTKVIEHL